MPCADVQSEGAESLPASTPPASESESSVIPPGESFETLLLRLIRLQAESIKSQAELLTVLKQQVEQTRQLLEVLRPAIDDLADDIDDEYFLDGTPQNRPS